MALTLVIVTTAAAAVGVVGFLLTDCAAPGLSLLGDDPVGLCAGLEQVGITPHPWMGLSLLVVGALAVFGIWAPTAKRRELRADLKSIKALRKNLDRVQAEKEAELEQAIDPLEELSKLVDQLREGFESEATNRTDLLETWIATARICNELLNTGELELEDFKRLNSGLLQFVSADLAEQRSSVFA